jgi:hypothetical protein
MEKDQKKKEYEKPKVTRIKIDAQCAVLGFCKTTSRAGPAVSGCQDGFGSNCFSQGS